MGCLAKGEERTVIICPICKLPISYKDANVEYFPNRGIIIWSTPCPKCDMDVDVTMVTER